jgi:hypothetical protein
MPGSSGTNISIYREISIMMRGLLIKSSDPSGPVHGSRSQQNWDSGVHYLDMSMYRSHRVAGRSGVCASMEMNNRRHRFIDLTAKC